MKMERRRSAEGRAASKEKREGKERSSSPFMMTAILRPCSSFKMYLQTERHQLELPSTYKSETHWISVLLPAPR